MSDLPVLQELLLRSGASLHLVDSRGYTVRALLPMVASFDCEQGCFETLACVFKQPASLWCHLYVCRFLFTILLFLQRPGRVERRVPSVSPIRNL